MDADVDVGLGRIRASCKGGSIGMEQDDCLSTGTGQGVPYGFNRCPQAPLMTDGDAASHEGSRAAAAQLALAYAADERTLGAIEAQPLEFVQGSEATYAIGGDRHIVLKLDHGVDRRRAKNAVDAPGVKAERAQPALELSDVVALEHWDPQVQEPVAQKVASLDQGSPGLGSADSVDAEAPTALKLTDCRSGLLIEGYGRLVRELPFGRMGRTVQRLGLLARLEDSEADQAPS